MSEPAEKILPVNAALLDLYVYAGTVTSNERWFARAVDLVGFIERKLIAANGAWRYTECAEPGRQFTDANGDQANGAATADLELGEDPETGLAVVLRNGRFGPYIQLGPDGEKGAEKPKRTVSLFTVPTSARLPLV